MAGDSDAPGSNPPSGSGELDARLYADLRAMARRALASERKDHTLQSADLVHEAWCKLNRSDLQWSSRGDFFAAAARAMRRILVDHARSRRALRRDAARKQRLEGASAILLTDTTTDILDLDTALERLSDEYPDAALVLEMRFFAGLELGEIARLRDVSRRTIDRVLGFAMSWLYRELNRSSS